jgi:ferredoxin-NADP reductase/phenylpropionate dioxygenase-like ring-hydroxylating dioxygenase large terminal subunit
MIQSIENPDALIAALDRGESLPAHWYTDAFITAREIEHVFRKSWNYVGPIQELSHPGDFITGYAGEVPVVVIRNQSGLAGFINVCRHRRHEVMKGRGNATMMRCGYHAWTYDLTGCLKGAPRSAIEPNFRLEDYPLLSLKVESLGPWVFVNLDPNAAPLVSHFGKLLDIITGSGINLDTLELYGREEWHAEANWKTMLENYLECYHCAVAHPGFSAAIDVMPENYNLGVHGWFLSQVGHVRESALAGKSAVEIYDARGEVAQAQYHLLWPNITININPGFPNLSVDVWVPEGPNRTKGFSEQYFGPGVSEEFAQELIAFNKQVGYEDDVLTNSVQKGLLGGIPERGRFLTNSEHLCIHFQKLVVNALARGPLALTETAQAGATQAPNTISVAPSASVVPESDRNTFVELEVANIEKESETISSFYLRRADGGSLCFWEPGQFLPIRVTIPGQAEPLLRTFTLSTCCNPDFYRLSIMRREGIGSVSEFLHDTAQKGFRLEAMMPRGKFVLDQTAARPVVLVSGGVGITPMMVIAEHIVEEGCRTGTFRPIYFIHGTQNSRVHAFRQSVQEFAARHPAMRVHICYSRPDLTDKIGVTHDAEGHITLDTLKQLLGFADYDFYLCGPAGFMNSLYSGLLGLGVRPERIHFESFGVGTVLKPEIPRGTAQHVDGSESTSLRVRFAKSMIDATWSPDNGTLLEFAEEVGLAPAFGCRSGICGTCKTKIESGAVRYLEEPLADRDDGEILLCCSVPSGRQDGENADLILDL